jgi:hypothetical protein
MSYNKILILIAFLNLASSATAQKYSNEFLSIGVGARAHGMANAQVANVSDVTSGYWNTAGLTNLQPNQAQVSAMHAEWFGGIGKYDYVSFALPIAKKNQYVGASFIRFGVDGIPNTLSLYEADGTVNYNNVTEFSAADYAFMGHFAQRFEKIGLSVGVSPKVIHRKIGSFASAWGFGIDAGAQYSHKNFKFGAQFRDITSTFNAWRFNFTDSEKQTLSLTNNEIPIKSVEITRPQLVIGAGYAKDFKIGKTKDGKKQPEMGFMVEMDWQITSDGKRNVLLSAAPFSADLMLGTELHYNKVVFLRAGVNNFQKFIYNNQTSWAVQPNFGLGFRIYNFFIDYAITNLGGNSGILYSHLVSARFNVDYNYMKKAFRQPQ